LKADAGRKEFTTKFMLFGVLAVFAAIVVGIGISLVTL
jgi:hypothetical protein